MNMTLVTLFFCRFLWQFNSFKIRNIKCVGKYIPVLLRSVLISLLYENLIEFLNEISSF